MSKRMVYTLVAVLALAAVIVGCATAPSGSLQSSRAFLDPSELGTVAKEEGAYRGESGAAPDIVVIEKRKQDLPSTQPAAPELPGSGALIAKLANDRKVPIPLKHTDVHANILGYISTVDVTQQYQNPYSEKIEAIYVFPLPQDAA